MTKSIAAAVLTALAVAGCRNAENKPAAQRTDDPLVSGRWMSQTPPTTAAAVGSFPVNLVVSPDGKYAISTGQGARQQLVAIRLSDGVATSRLDFRTTSIDKSNGLYFGLVFGPDGHLYAAQGAAGRVAVVSLSASGELEKHKAIETGAGSFPSGLAVDRKSRLYVVHNDPTPAKGQVLNAPAYVTIHDTTSGKEIGRHVFADEVGLSNFPLAIAVNDDGSKVYIGSQRDDCVYVLNATDPAKITQVGKLTTGSHPVALLLNKDQSKLFVGNAHSDTVSIVDTAKQAITHTVLLRPQVAKDLAGATPLGFALSANEKFLYVALGDMNAIAVVDVKDSKGPELEGYIPVGWYPTAVVASGSELLVANAKGDKARNPNDGDPKTGRVGSPLRLFEGTVWRVPVPDKVKLKALTEQSIENSRLTAKFLGAENPLKNIGLQAGKIRHVIYVIKENRTYDHVLGDLPRGNGDPKRCLFGRDVTPNQHALADRFVLLDNFYDSGDVSGDGWTWSTQAQSNEYTVRNVPYSYSGRGRTFDYEGQVNQYPSGGFPAKGPDGKPLSDDPRFAQGAKPVNDVGAAPGGHLWDLAKKQGLTVRNYGFFSSNGVKQAGKTIIPDNWPTATGLLPGGHDLEGTTNVDFRRFDMDYPDSDAPQLLAQQKSDLSYLWPMKSFGKAGSASRFSEWKREFDLMLAKDPTGKTTVPNLMLIRFPTDHTTGASARKPTPRCMVADNDYAVGQLIEAVSHSPIWPHCAIVIIEDDAQNGPDHVDAHRSICFVASPYMKRGAFDRSFQNTVSAIKTIECLLGLPPMNQYDAASGIIGGWDTEPRNIEPFKAVMPKAEYFLERNAVTNALGEPISPESPNKPLPDTRSTTRPVTKPAAKVDENRPLRSAEDLAAASAEMDFSKADRAPAHLLNRVIWKSVRGVESELPPTPRTIKPVVAGGDDDDDDD